MDLVLYGAYNLSSDKCYLTSAQGSKDLLNRIQKVDNAKSAGSTIVDTRVLDKSITLEGTLSAMLEQNLNRTIEEFDEYIAKEDRYLRICNTWYPIVKVEDADTWTLGSDAINKVLDTANYQFGTASLKFDADVSVSADNKITITKTTNTTTDISEFAGLGMQELWVFIPDVQYVTSIDIKFGSDSSNYFTYSFTKQIGGSAFENGWNYLSVALIDCVMTGNVDYYSYGAYFQLAINYQSAQADLAGFRFGGSVWQYDDDTRNYRGNFETVSKDVSHYAVTKTKFSASFLCNTGISNSTDDIDALVLSAQTSYPTTNAVTFLGTYEPEPVISVTINSISNVDKLGLSNLSTGDTVEIDETWVAGDVIVFDFENKIITRNNSRINYSSVLPRFNLGKNLLYIYATSTSESIISYTTQNINLAGTI